MTKQEKIIVSAYTGVLMCDFDDLHEYIEKKFGRPVFTHELADKSFQKEIKEKTKEEFLEICNREEPERKNGRWIEDGKGFYMCSSCGKLWVHWWARVVPPNQMCKELRYCPSCGAYMRGDEE